MLTIDFDRFKLEDGDRILDLGCGVGRHVITSYTLKNIEAVGVDLSHGDLGTARKRYEEEFAEPDNESKRFVLTVANALSLPFADNSFDKVICSEVLEHIPDYKSALGEIKRVLKPGGILAASVPRFFPEWICWRLSLEYHSEEGGHVRIFNAAQLRRDIEEQGMVCYGRHWAHALHVPYWWLQCLFWANKENSKIIKAYHRFLVWDLIKKPWITRTMDKVLNPLIGKSIVMYFEKD
ncbi:MAG: class I SAM-dependent methyltransferase [Proteobacteria bacterium]|nr:class I SAM-dependent methyltransferase [Pseudomonadota bacterium]